MTKVIHSDFLLAQKQCAHPFSPIEKNQAWGSDILSGSCVGIVLAHAPEGNESTLHRAGI